MFGQTAHAFEPVGRPFVKTSDHFAHAGDRLPLHCTGLIKRLPRNAESPFNTEVQSGGTGMNVGPACSIERAAAVLNVNEHVINAG